MLHLIRLLWSALFERAPVTPPPPASVVIIDRMTPDAAFRLHLTQRRALNGPVWPPSGLQ